jgi:hypothetical protein
MSNDKRNERSLDSALDGNSADDETRPLVETADSVKQALAVDVPPADRQRALFLSGVAARERRLFSPARVLVPAFALALIVFAAFAGQNALPGQGLYPVREALNSVGIGDTPGAEIEDHLFHAARKLKEADDVVDESPARARNIAIDCLRYLDSARDFLPELDGERAEERLEQIADFEDDAVDILIEAREEEQEALEDREDAEDSDSDDSDSGDDDNSGSGSDDSGSDDDNSGSGSDDSGSDDNSGSGSDDSSGSGSDSDDNSGSGSDDSSGSGSGSDDSGSSGSGSGDND